MLLPKMSHLILIIVSLLPLSSSAFSPAPYYYLACGSATSISLQSDNPSRIFISDSAYLSNSSSSSSKSLRDRSTPSSLYATARLFTRPSSYQFDTSSFQGTYIIRLHFFPFPASPYDLSAANFSVLAQGRFELLASFSIPDNTTDPIIKEYFLWVETDQLTLTFTPNPLAFVNAIEVFNAPPNLIDDSTPAYVTPSGNGTPLGGQVQLQGFETLYRVNVGGPLVTPENDTLWRTWVPDDRYILGGGLLSFKNSTSPAAVKYNAGDDQRRTPEIAPPSVYDTARTMAVTPMLAASNSNFNFNITWSFRVSPRETHFIRLHFCDFLFNPVTELVFNVYIGRLLARADLQPYQFTDQTPAGAFYLDFAADSDANGFVNVSIGKSNISTPATANAILNGLEIMKLGLDSVAADNNHRKHHLMIILIPSIIGGIVLVGVLLLATLLVCRRRQRTKTAAEPKAPSTTPLSPVRPDTTNSVYITNSRSTVTTSPLRFSLALQIPFEEIRLATDNFADKLVIGSGGFGKVYKGVLRDGTAVAVKRGMPGSRQGYPEFHTEIEVLSQIRHRHLVALVGYCDDQSEMILVYEYMEKGPLKNHLYGSSDLPCLTWKQRLEICIAAARGLHYLHTGYSCNIIHRDIKSTNILLGEGYLAKVADFGLSRLGPSLGETHVSTGVKGTFGYLDPEYFKIQKLTDKSDVYSFGVMMFEVACARPVIDPNLSREQLNLAEWALAWQRKGQLERIIDPRLAGAVNANSLRKFGETAEKCLANYGVERPSMGDVLWSLEYALRLQETEVRREPFEDSGAVEAQLPVNVMRRAPSNVGEENGWRVGEGETGVSERETGVSESVVFSQLAIRDGR